MSILIGSLVFTRSLISLHARVNDASKYESSSIFMLFSIRMDFITDMYDLMVADFLLFSTKYPTNKVNLSSQFHGFLSNFIINPLNNLHTQ